MAIQQGVNATFLSVEKLFWPWGNYRPFIIPDK